MNTDGHSLDPCAWDDSRKPKTTEVPVGRWSFKAAIASMFSPEERAAWEQRFVALCD